MGKNTNFLHFLNLHIFLLVEGIGNNTISLVKGPGNGTHEHQQRNLNLRKTLKKFPF
jgi:hypothetical protein